MKKLDILNMRDGGDTAPGEDLPWQIVGGKVTKIEKKEEIDEIPYEERDKSKPKLKPGMNVDGTPYKEIRIEGPTVQEGIKEVKVLKTPSKKKKKKKKRKK